MVSTPLLLYHLLIQAPLLLSHVLLSLYVTLKIIEGHPYFCAGFFVFYVFQSVADVGSVILVSGSRTIAY